MRLATKQLFNDAYGKYGIAAFNIFNTEQILGVFRGAAKAKSPVIIQITPVARNYIHPEILDNILAATEKRYPDVCFTIHLDHGDSIHCIDAIKSGCYNSVMIDASHETFKKNVQITREIVNRAHNEGIAVEAELGVIRGVEDRFSVEKKMAYCTDPEMALEFVEHTGCDSLAVAVGNRHGTYKLSPGQGLQLGLLARINSLLPGFPLVLHGASSVSAIEVERINRAGGKLSSEAKGLEKKEILQAIRLGVCKINIATDLRLLWTRVHREFFQNSPAAFDMTIPGLEYMDCLEQLVSEKCMDLIISNANNCPDETP
ncbi:MAG: class II fructose-bisphosphate aldolase [Bacteroidales bacterium]|nr:class II fructose-bisphosphate aldolase [Bacteroidales bacterium]